MQMFSNARGKIRAFSFLHVPIPTALRTSLSSSSLLTLSKTKILETWKIKTCQHVLVMHINHVVLRAKRKRKECLRTIGMGGTGKHQTKASTSHFWRRKQTGWAFLYVPIPTALEPSFFLFPSHS
ncbi:hypothetical protein PVAP13_7KG160255, partial [Panicum virgatum]